MKNIVHHIIRGCGELPTFGDHPGTGIVVILIAAMTAAGGWCGLLVSSLCYLPVYFWGAYSRSIGDPPENS
jgi:hypothetical protein